MDKKELRTLILNKRDNIIDKEKKDISIIDTLIDTDYYKESKKIFIYIGFGSEINTLKLIEIFLQGGKDVYVPKTNIQKKEMKAVKIKSLDKLALCKYGILEPDNEDEVIDREDIDLIIVPGVAFDKSGGRVGYGGGFYDKYLSKIIRNTAKVALAYDFQIINEVPTEDHDIKIDCIITDKDIIKII